MLPFDPVTAGSLVILASTPGITCDMDKATQINVVPTTQEVEYDHSPTLVALQDMAVNTANPYGFHKATYTQGFMKGAIKMEPSVKLSGYVVEEEGYACLWYNEINLNIEIDPEIVIAKEVYADECTRKSVLAHEMKHVEVDRDIVNKYAKIMGNKVYDALNERGFLVGPIPLRRQEAVTKRMQDAVFDIIEHEHKRMELERADMQAEIDSLEEYERVSAQCPDSHFDYEAIQDGGGIKTYVGWR